MTTGAVSHITARSPCTCTNTNLISGATVVATIVAVDAADAACDFDGGECCSGGSKCCSCWGVES
jgi:hypothetical protein